MTGFKGKRNEEIGLYGQTLIRGSNEKVGDIELIRCKAG